MLKLITLPNQRFAQAFVDYMATQDVILNINHHAEGADILLADEALLPQVKLELDYFIQHPNDPRYLAASWQTGHLSQKIKFNRFIEIQRAGFITVSVTIICLIVYFLMNFLGNYRVMSILAFPYALPQYAQIWRWLTPVFLHFSILHIVFNLSWWWYLGRMVERQAGKFKLLEIFLLSGIISNFCQSVYSGANFGGLSGVVYALISYCWLIGERDQNKGIFLERPMMIFAFIWLLAGFSGYLGPIANIAHLVGLLIGLLLAWKDMYILSGKKASR